MKRFVISAAVAAGIAAAASSAQAGLVISEVVYNEVGSSFLGEWIEIYNNGSAPIDLSNYKIGDEETSGQTGTTEALYQFPAGASIAAGEVQVIASGAERFFEIYSFKPNYEFAFSGDGTIAASDDATVPNLSVYTAWDSDGDRLNMSNSNDQAVLLDGTDTIIDAVSWGNTVAFNPGLAATVADGQSYFRANPLVDTNTAADWTLGNLSSPGVVVVPEPASAVLFAVIAPMVRRRR